MFFLVVQSRSWRPRRVKITQAKTKDGAIETVPTQRPFEGFFLHVNSRDNV